MLTPRWTAEDTSILQTPIHVMEGLNQPNLSPAERDSALMLHLARESLFRAVERTVDLNHQRIIAVVYMNHDEPHPAPYAPAYSKGDLLVTLCGYGLGSRAWVQNWGAWRPKLKGV